jgi:hypothetical protein
MLRPMNRLSILLLVAAALSLGACQRGPTDPGLVEDAAPLTDCSEEAFIRHLGGGRAVVCRGPEGDPAVRACIAPRVEGREPYAHVVDAAPGEPKRITVFTPERRVYQARFWPRPEGERVELWPCRRATEMPADPLEMPYYCPLPGERGSATSIGSACEVLERARKIRQAEAKEVKPLPKKE